MVIESVNVADLSDTFTIHSIFNDQHDRFGLRHEETAISNAAVPEPETNTEVYSSSILKALSNLVRIAAIKSENSFFSVTEIGEH